MPTTTSANLLVQARRTAGLSQRELAGRAGVAQQEIARYERGHVTPSLERLRALIGACGLELTLGLARADDSYDAQIAAALALTPAARLRAALADAQALRQARARTRDASEAATPDVIGVLRSLEEAGIRYVLIGQLAELLHSSPLLALTPAVAIVAQAGQRDQLGAAIAAAGGSAVSPSNGSEIERPASFELERYGTELSIEPAPPGTRGYEDLRQDATTVRVAKDLTATVASLVDLVRIAEASNDRSRVPALRRTLELAADSSAADAA